MIRHDWLLFRYIRVIKQGNGMGALKNFKILNAFDHVRY